MSAVRTVPAVVAFVHDDHLKRWEVLVRGVESCEEAIQAFTAVILTAHCVDTDLLGVTQADEVEIDEGMNVTYRMVIAQR